MLIPVFGQARIRQIHDFSTISDIYPTTFDSLQVFSGYSKARSDLTNLGFAVLVAILVAILLRIDYAPTCPDLIVYVRLYSPSPYFIAQRSEKIVYKAVDNGTEGGREREGWMDWFFLFEPAIVFHVLY